MVITEVDGRFGDVEQVHILALSTFLDPRFKNIHFNNPRALAQVHLRLNSTIKEDINTSNILNSNKMETDAHACSSIQAKIVFGAFTLSWQKKNINTPELDENVELKIYLSKPVQPIHSNFGHKIKIHLKFCTKLHLNTFQLLEPLYHPRGYFLGQEIS